MAVIKPTHWRIDLRKDTKECCTEKLCADCKVEFDLISKDLKRLFAGSHYFKLTSWLCNKHTTRTSVSMTVKTHDNTFHGDLHHIANENRLQLTVANYSRLGMTD